MHDEAERSVIGAMLVNNQVANKLTLTREMFINTNLGIIYDTIRSCVASGVPADLVTISSRISEDMIPHETLNKLLVDCAARVPASTMYRHYSNDVLRQYKARKARAIFSDVDGANIDEKISEYRRLVDRTKDNDTSGVSAQEAVSQYSGSMFRADRAQGIPLGFEDLDGTLGGLHGGDMCIIAARPSVGKSAFSTEISLNMAKAGHRVDIFNLEMTVEQVYQRQIAHESGISLSRIRRATCFLSHTEEDYFMKGNEALAKLPIKIYDSVNRVSEIVERAKEDKAEVVIIDYMQLIAPESVYKGNRTAEVGQISHAIKSGAKRLNIPFIVLAQLNRVSTLTKTLEPSMSELREAGDMEQDADQIILLWNADEGRRKKGVKIDKNRQGECGSGTLMFDGAVMQFTEVDETDGCPFEP